MVSPAALTALWGFFVQEALRYPWLHVTAGCLVSERVRDLLNFLYVPVRLFDRCHQRIAEHLRGLRTAAWIASLAGLIRHAVLS